MAFYFGDLTRLCYKHIKIEKMSALSLMRMMHLPPITIEEYLPVSPVELTDDEFLRIKNIQENVSRYLEHTEVPNLFTYKQPFEIEQNFRKHPHKPPIDKGYVEELSINVEFLNSDNLESEQPYYWYNG